MTNIPKYPVFDYPSHPLYRIPALKSRGLLIFIVKVGFHLRKPYPPLSINFAGIIYLLEKRS